MTTPPIWMAAASMSARAHEHQLRKDGRTPYAAHPSRVAMIIAVVFGVDDPAVLAAAYLHDLIEDTGCDYDEIAGSFGAEVADLCAAMSKDMRLVEPERERAYDAQLAAASWTARLIKLADVYDNLSDADDAAREKLIGKCRRALALAEGDERLEKACRAVKEIMER